ncbi:MAG: sugar kinase [Pseudomonadota bacterium]
MTLNNPNRLLGIGECMVELAPVQGFESDAELVQVGFAGDVLNTLWYARAAFGTDGQASFCSAVGTDQLSDRMLEFIETGGIDCGLVRRVADRRPGLYMIHLEGAERSFSYWRGESAARLLAADHSHLKNAIDNSSAIYLSGITLAILSPDDRKTLIAMMRQARENGQAVAFDPNIRPALWESQLALQDTITEAAAVSSIILPSHDDEATHFGDANPEHTISRYGAKGRVIIVKDGAGDVLVASEETIEKFPTPPVHDAVDTTGAGDSFNGAFLASYLLTGDAKEAVAAGQTCSARVIRHRGALIHEPV